MPHIHVNRRKPATVALALVALLLVSLGLAACGSSSSSSSSTTATTSASTGAGTGTGAKGPNAGRFAAVRECLEKEGITLPKRTPGQKRPPGGTGGFLGGGGATGGPKLPAGVTRAKYEAALKKCGGGGTLARGGAARFDSPTFKAALAKFATCMRQNGVDVPAPNTSGNGPVFDTKGIDTSSTQFKTAEVKCQSDLSGAFKRGPGAAGGAGGVPGTNGAPAGAAPPSSGEAPGGAAGPPAG